MYKECYLGRIFQPLWKQDAYCNACLLRFLGFKKGLLFAAVSFTQIYILLDFTLILHVHFWWQRSNRSPLTKHLDTLLYQSITLNSGQSGVMKQPSSKRVRVELENKHSAFSAALCRQSFWACNIWLLCVRRCKVLFIWRKHCHNVLCSTLLQCLLHFVLFGKGA